MTAINNMALEEVEAEIVLMALAGQAVLAAEEWRARRDRCSRPAGKWDNGGRFYPSSEEWHPLLRGEPGPVTSLPILAVVTRPYGYPCGDDIWSGPRSTRPCRTPVGPARRTHQ